jgi:glutamyl-tRNA synthetase
MPGAVRVRFAPSPTGMFHVGGARTALWNWLFARQSGGIFILRIEDTDEARNEPQWVDGIRSALRWLELDWDEEYLASANAASHRAAAERLYREGRAYYCDCTTADIDGRRPPGPPTGYDGFCRDRGIEPAPGRALRFRVPAGETVVEDLVRGTVVFDNAKIGGDFVIVKGNGGPIFYLANTVDDLDESMTHVLRGEEHLPNTPKNQLLWRALSDQPPPVWAHLPNLVNERRQKLSKRRDKVALESFRDEGYLMEALRNYLCLLGWAPHGDREILTLDEMLTEFRLDEVNSSPAFFDVKKLRSVNEQYLRRLDPAAFVAAIVDFARPVLDRMAELTQTRVSTLADVPGMVDFLFGDDARIDLDSWQKGVLNVEAARSVLAATRAAFAESSWNAEELKAGLEAVGEGHGLKLAKAQAPVRVAVTGRSVGPPLFESLELLGRERTLRRLDSALARLPGGTRPPGGE